MHPHCKDRVVEILGIRYKAEWWFSGDSGYYIFKCLDWEKGEPIYHEQRRKEEEVSNALKKGVIKPI